MHRLAPGLIFLAILITSPTHAQPCNTPPEAAGELAIVRDDRFLVLDVLANDYDSDGDPLTVAVLGNACPGPVTVGEDETLLYEPDAVADTLDCVISYQVEDLVGETASATATVTVEPFIPEIFADGFESGDTTGWTLEGTDDGGEDERR